MSNAKKRVVIKRQSARQAQSDPSVICSWRISAKLKLWFESYAKRLGMKPGRALEDELKKIKDREKEG